MRRRAAFPWTAALGAVWIPLSALFAVANAAAEIVDHAFSGSLSIEGRWYPDTAAYPRQRAHASGLAAAPELYLEDAEGRGVTVAAFLRYDAGDPERTHIDLREAYLLLLGEAGDGEWELRLGIDRVFWGVAESRNPVDIVNHRPRRASRREGQAGPAHGPPDVVRGLGRDRDLRRRPADTDYATRTLTVELNRRLSDRWSVRLEAVALLDVDDADILLHATRRDSFIALNLQHDF
ncbi:MAG: hypothetical protein J4F33_02485 [Alphaproteobacteria bacterium]|nr:hypothetical protein [Alphaproteobacteria bacterium]